MIQRLLSDFGLNEKEIQVYLTILEQGKISPLQIAGKTGLKRTTVYSVSNALLEKGFIEEDLGQATRYFTARPLRILPTILEEEEKSLSQKREILKALIPALQEYPKADDSTTPKIRFVPEKKILNQLYERTESWNQSAIQRGGMWWGFQDHSFAEHFEEWIHWLWKKATPKDVSIRLFTNFSQVERSLALRKYKNRQIKTWKGSAPFTASIWIAGDFLIMINTQEKPYYLVEIRDVLLAQNLRLMFQGLWT